MQDKLRQNFLNGYIKINKKLPLFKLSNNWANSNLMLDNFYKRPEINIINNPKGLNIKNSMRHIVGSSKYQQDYGFLAIPFGYIKEGFDIITEPFIYMGLNKSFNYPKYLYKTFKDTIIDNENNKIGRKFIKQNPKATDEEIMKYALQQALLNYDK